MQSVETNMDETSLDHVEGTVDAVKERGSREHERLRRLFARVGRKLRDLGDVVVFIDGHAEAVAPCTSPQGIIVLAGKEPGRHCVYRLNPCGGPPTPFNEGDVLEDGHELVVSLCTPPADGADRAQALAKDIALLSRAAKNVRVVRLREGQDALLGEFAVAPGDVAIAGVVVNPQYPAVGPDWFLLDTSHEIVGFGGGKRGPLHEGEAALMEHSIHPPSDVVPSAAEHILSVVTRKLGLVRRVAA